jgi:hypothetical protein
MLYSIESVVVENIELFPGSVVNICNPSYSGGEDSRVIIGTQHKQKSISKNKADTVAALGMAEVGGSLSEAGTRYECETLSEK